MPQRPSPSEDLAIWSSVDRYFGVALGDGDDALHRTLRASEAAGLPSIQVSPLQGKLLYLLARAVGARTILEIGTLGGYSTTWLARALPADGRLVTLELEPHHAEVARSNLEQAGLAGRVEIRVGPAAESLERLLREGAGPFDLVFIDADKTGYPAYLDGAVRLSRPGSLIIADNVVRRGDVADETTRDPSVRGIREMTERISKEPRLAATVVQTVGAKGYDGMVVAVVQAPGGESTRGRAGAR
ncbi:MAG TPA: O-methyltransferase [Thermoplasmata archaeon]|nr:O-methyltransferase [Thermoplasmata archaeon]